MMGEDDATGKPAYGRLLGVVAVAKAHACAIEQVFTLVTAL